MSSLSLSFNDVNFNPVPQNDGQTWITSSELAKALGYSRADKVTELYNRNIDEFTPNMTQVIEIPQNLNLGVSEKPNNLVKKVRIFSLRGCHLVAIFARTPVAKDFRCWVLDILEKETKPIQKPLSGAEYLLQMAQQMVEQERRLALQEQHLATHDIQIKEIQAKQQALTDSSDFFSVLAFANLHNIGLTNGQLSALSRKCGKLSKENGVMIGKISDPRFGRVKTYHRNILVEAFNKAGYA